MKSYTNLRSYKLSALNIEGELAVETEEEECKIITEQTVFDHIREKAKNFPVLATSNNVQSPSSEAWTLPRKRIRANQVELDSAVEETDRNDVLHQIVHIPSSEPQEVDQSKSLTPKQQTTARGSGTSAKSLVNDRGALFTWYHYFICILCTALIIDLYVF